MQIVVVDSIEKGLERAKEELYKRIDRKTVLFLSGGSTPKSLYSEIAKEKILKPAVAAMIDERFGKKLHGLSNEKMISETGLLDYFESIHIPFYSILHSGLTREQTAQAYDKKARDLFFHFNKSVGVLGIGTDGHTAGIPALPVIARGAKQSHVEISATHTNWDPINDIYNTQDFVTSYNDTSGNYGERVTLTFAGLSLLDFFIVLAFGAEKEHALKQVFTPGSLKEIPSRFYNSAEISKKTLFITDQKV